MKCDYCMVDHAESKWKNDECPTCGATKPQRPANELYYAALAQAKAPYYTPALLAQAQHQSLYAQTTNVYGKSIFGGVLGGL